MPGVEVQTSPLQIRIDELRKTLAGASSIVISVIASLEWFLRWPFLETVTAAVNLAVAAISEVSFCSTIIYD